MEMRPGSGGKMMCHKSVILRFSDSPLAERATNDVLAKAAGSSSAPLIVAGA